MSRDECSGPAGLFIYVSEHVPVARSPIVSFVNWRLAATGPTVEQGTVRSRPKWRYLMSNLRKIGTMSWVCTSGSNSIGSGGPWMHTDVIWIPGDAAFTKRSDS